MNTWNTIVIISAALLLLFLIWKEWMRPNKKRLVWRLLASVFSVVCLVCMGLPLTYHPSPKRTDTILIVATEGTDNDSLQHFIKTQNKKALIYQTDDFLSAENLLYDSIHVFGYGFSEEELSTIDNLHLIFHSTPIKTGITAISWNHQVKKGTDLMLQGTYTNKTSLPVTVLLNGFNVVLDSINIPAGKTETFQLHTVPKQNGNAVYSVIAKQKNDILEKNALPVEVVMPTPVKVMILSASPDFENKFLKDWLSQNGYTVITKTTISTNKFDKSFFNTDSISMNRITPSLMESFDVLITDELSLSGITQLEKENIYRQVSEKGLGLVIRADSLATRPAWYALSFPLYNLQGKQPTHLSLTVKAGNPNSILPVDQPQFIRYQIGTQPLIMDSANNILASSAIEGSGKIVFTTVNNTYSWLLSGNTENYYSLWNMLLQKAAKHTIQPITVENLPALPVTGQQVNIRLTTILDSLPIGMIAPSKLSFAENQSTANQWETSYWPSETGWQSPVSIQNSNHYWYVYDKNDWAYISRNNRTAVTSLYSQQKGNMNKNIAINKPSPIPVSLFYFFLPFIICSGFLWLERKKS